MLQAKVFKVPDVVTPDTESWFTSQQYVAELAARIYIQYSTLFSGSICESSIQWGSCLRVN